MLADKPSGTCGVPVCPRTVCASNASSWREVHVDPKLLWLKIRRTEPVGLAGFSVAGGLVDMVSSRKPSLVAVIGFIAAFICLIIYWNRAGDVSQPKTEDVSQAKTEADCQKAGGMWDMNMCMEKK